MAKIGGEKTMKKKVILPGIIALGIIALAVFMASPSFAQTPTSNTLVTRIAERFGLNEEDVQAEFDSFQDEKRAERYALFAERLNDLTTEGKITEDQKVAILDKHEEIQEQMEVLHKSDSSDKKDEMRALHDELKSFMEDLGVDLSMIGPMGGEFGFGGHGHMGRFEMGMN
jgi:predicted RNA-binding Zn ribbon-like protein